MALRKVWGSTPLTLYVKRIEHTALTRQKHVRIFGVKTSLENDALTITPSAVIEMMTSILINSVKERIMEMIKSDVYTHVIMCGSVIIGAVLLEESSIDG